MLGRAFKSGNSLAVRIPQEIGVINSPGDVEIERVGDSIVIRPIHTQSLASAIAKFSAFPEGFMAEGREHHEEHEREDW